MRYLFILLLSTSLFSAVNAQGWLARSDFGGVGRHRGTGIAIGNKGYIGLGHVNGTGLNVSYNDWWQYDPAANTWTQKANYVAASYGAVAFGTSTKGYVGGGTAFTTQYFEYNPVTNLWTGIANCPLTISNQTAFSVEEKGYVILGNQIAEFNPIINSWVMKANLPASLNIWSTSFVVGTSAFVKNGTQLYEYKPAQDMWLPRASCSGIATGGSSAFTVGEKGYIISGYSGSLANVTKEVWQFNPATNTWLQMSDFDGAARRFSVGFNINGRGYFGSGTNGINFNDFWAFDHFLKLEETSAIVDCSVFPNPTTDVLNFRINNSNETSPVKLEIFDLTGKVWYSSYFNTTEFSISIYDLPSGNYTYTLSRDGKMLKADHLQKTAL